jgi:hypothetical protein
VLSAGASDATGSSGSATLSTPSAALSSGALALSTGSASDGFSGDLSISSGRQHWHHGWRGEHWQLLLAVGIDANVVPSPLHQHPHLST